jgi:peptidoglycan/LPS O-acetylase OafA/YrhL
VASFVLLGLIVFVVVANQVGHLLDPAFRGSGDAVLGLLLGALCALVGIQGVDFLKRS